MGCHLDRSSLRKQFASLAGQKILRIMLARLLARMARPRPAASVIERVRAIARHTMSTTSGELKNAEVSQTQALDAFKILMLSFSLHRPQ